MGSCNDSDDVLDGVDACYQFVSSVSVSACQRINVSTFVFCSTSRPRGSTWFLEALRVVEQSNNGRSNVVFVFLSIVGDRLGYRRRSDGDPTALR